MTRENKLALVVGFALILLVGILISDHFSTARTLNAAELTQAIDPLADERHANPDLIALRSDITSRPAPARPAEPEAAPRSSTRLAIDEPRPSESGVRALDTVVAGPGASERRPGAGMRVASSSIVTPDVRQHRVKSGESLSTISSRHYGDGTLFRKLAEYNDLDDPDAIRSGLVLRLPPVEMLKGRAPETRGTLEGQAPVPPPVVSDPMVPAEAQPRPASASPPTYTVQSGDNLSKIAKKLLGSMNRWNAIYEANRAQLETPDDLKPGMKLTIPEIS